VQEAAYGSLLKSRRRELHHTIARVIEQRFPAIKTIKPEVLAHHLTAADHTEAAIPLWQAAGELALKRMALTEAISHLTQGLDLASTLPRSSQRDTCELDLRRLAEKHRHLADILNQDPKCAAGIHGSVSAWVLGYPDRAESMQNRGVCSGCGRVWG
jgi:predicted ATPase